MTTELVTIEIEDYWDEEFKIIFEKINHSKSTDELLKCFKNFTSKIKSNGYNEECLRKLLQIYFTVKIKHPVKNLIQAALSHLQNDEKAFQIFNTELEKQICHFTALPLNDRYHLVSCLNEMSQNFYLAEKSVGYHADLLIDFLTSNVKSYLETIKQEVSQSSKNELSHRLHNCIQATIFCIKSHYSEGKNCNQNVKQLLFSIADICIALLDSDDISLETKNICAILIVINNTKASLNDNHTAIIQNQKEKPTKRLCLMFGMLTVQQELQITNFECLTKILEEVYIKNTLDNAVICAIARLFTIITKKLSQMKLPEFSTHLQTITKITLSVSFLNLEHYIESVRYLAKDSLRNLVEIGNKISNSMMIKEIFSAIISTSSINTQTVIINAIHSTLPIADILQFLPEFQISLLSSIDINKEHKMSCYEGISSKFKKENTFDEWYENFIEPIMKNIKIHQNSEEKTSLLKCLLLKCIKKNKVAIKMILANNDNHDDIGFHLLCLSMAKMEGALDEFISNDETWKGVISFNDIKRYMVNINDDIRLAALQLIVDSKKSTEYFTKNENDCILYFFEMNINVQNPTTRQSILSMIKKIFIRLNSSIQSLLKKSENENKNLSNQLDMLRKFFKCCFDNLAEGANYSRRSLSLNILSHILLIFREYFPSEIISLWKNDNFNVLLNTFYDTFETNKENVLEIMQYLPQSIITTHSKICLEHIEKLMSSIKPADSLSAAYLLQFSLKFDLLSSKLSVNSEISSKCPETYKLLVWCENLLLKALVVGEKSIIVAAGSNPMYGSLLCIRYIISKLDLCDLGTCYLWQNFFERIICICKRLSHVVAPIVYNSSPEGCIPNEDLSIIDDNDEYFEKIFENTTPQMVLLCAWRTTREVSLLMGDLSLRAPLTVDQMMEIGQHFIELLSNVKHRGAFEQCFFGFSQYSIALRMSSSEKIYNMPERLLRNIIISISGESDKNENDFMQIKNLCATRRSAGVPYIIQSLLTSEIKIAKAKNFHFVMKNLIEFARNGVQMETRIHSLNILRALFRCKEFNDVIGEYISPALQSSLLGYGSQSWAERNSSTLLFSALMIRIFGVQRNKDSEDINIKNKLSGRVFFLRYPELYDFFMAQLIEAIDYVKEQRMNSKLHPLMLLLNRLYTSITDNSESNLKLIDFIPIVAICSSCSEFQTRVLCAKFIANVIQPCQLLSRVNENIRNLKENPNLIGNSKHAKVLEIYYLVKKLSIDSVKVDAMIEILNEILGLLVNFKNEIISFGTLVDVVIEISKKHYKHLPHAETKINRLENCFDFNKSAYFGLPLLQSKMSAINLMRGEIGFALSITASMNSCELLEKLNCLILLLNCNNTSSLSSSELAEEFEINQEMCFFAENLSNNMRQDFRLKINSHESLISELKELAKSNDANLASRCLEILASINVKIDRKVVELVINRIEEKPEVMKKSILKHIGMYIQQENNFITDINWNFLLKIIDSSSFHVKSTLIDLLFILLNNMTELKSIDALFSVIKSTILLLVDDDFEIRRKTSSTIVTQLLRLNDVYMGSYAQKLFLCHLLQQSTITKDKVIGMIIILMYEEEIENQYRESNNIACEFQVFEKNESNNFRETFAMRKLCMPILSSEMQSLSDVNIKEVSTICQNSENLEEFITRTFS